MAKLFIKQAGAWVETMALYVKDLGVQRQIKFAYIKDAGIWRRVFGTPSTTIAFTPGVTNWVVPAGVYTLTNVTVVGGGGGGGGTASNGDSRRGGGGGSGGYYANQTIPVTPGETLTITVGAGGDRGGVYYNFQQFPLGLCGNSGCSGGTTSIYRGATNLYTATGGQGGQYVTYGAGGYGGVGGLPGGVAGADGTSVMNNFYTTGSVSNGTGYGSGGASNASLPGWVVGTAGQAGVVSVSW